jgi:hypothetical protein
MGNLVDIIVNLHIDTAEAQKVAMNELRAQAMVLKGRSQALCPVDSGTLRNSAVIEEGDTYIEVGYGGEASAYAAIQHENMSFHHPVGQAKYLEQPATEMEEEIKAAVARAVAEAFK